MARKRQRGHGETPGDPMIPLIRAAREQIEDEEGGPLGWLVGFVRKDRRLPGDVEADGHRLLALVYGPMPPNLLQLGSGDIPPITPGDVANIHAELRAFLTRLVTAPAGELIDVPTDGLKEAIVRASAPSNETLVNAVGPSKVPAIFAVTRGGPRRTLLFQAVKALVLESKRLMACPQCKKPFLALRRKKFCSGPCLQIWWDAKRSKKGAA